MLARLMLLPLLLIALPGCGDGGQAQQAAANAAESLRDQADTLQTSGDPDEALALIDEAILADPDNPLNYVTKGDALYLLSRFEAAVEAYESAQALAPDLPEAYLGHALALHQMRRYDQATRTLARVERLYEARIEELGEPTFRHDRDRLLTAQANLAWVRFLSGRQAHAIAEIRELYRQAPEHDVVRDLYLAMTDDDIDLLTMPAVAP